MNRKEILDSYNFRYACKEFDIDKKISEDDFNLILEAGRLSPSSVGLEPWRFIIVQNNELRKKLVPLCSGAIKQLETASHFVIILARTYNSLKYNSEYVDYILKEVKDAPNAIIENTKNFLKRIQENSDADFTFNWACKQTYIALANMLTCSAQIKIDSCPIEGFNKNAVEELLIQEGILDKENFGLSCMVAFGYRKDTNQSMRKRQSLEKITQWIY